MFKIKDLFILLLNYLILSIPCFLKEIIMKIYYSHFKNGRNNNRKVFKYFIPLKLRETSKNLNLANIYLIFSKVVLIFNKIFLTVPGCNLGHRTASQFQELLLGVWEMVAVFACCQLKNFSFFILAQLSLARLSWESNFCVRQKVSVVAGRQPLRPFYCLCRNATIA